MLALYPQVPSRFLLSLSVWAVASGLEGEWANSSGESREEKAAESAGAWVRPLLGPDCPAEAGPAAPVGAHPDYCSPAAREPKGVWTTGRQGGGSALGAGLRGAARPRPASTSNDPPRDPPLGQRREPEAPARAPETSS